MKVCYFGIYNDADPRNKEIKEGLKRNGIKVVECNGHVDTKHGPIKGKLGLIRYKFLTARAKIRCYLSLIRKYRNMKKDFDHIIVGFPNEYDTLIIKAITLFSRKKIICDFFNPVYYTAAVDREAIGKRSLTAVKLFIIDKASSVLANHLLADTEQHRDLISRIYRINPKKFIITPVTIDDKLFKKAKSEECDKSMVDDKNDDGKSSFIVFFRPTFSPKLTGAEHVIKAMGLLEKEGIRFYLAGDGISKEDVSKIYGHPPKNIEFLGWVDNKRISHYTGMSDVCITGHFGPSIKAECVINFKTIEAIALGKPVIINSGRANRKIFTDSINCLMVQKENPKELAKAILLLKNDPVLRKSIGENAYKLYKERFMPEKTVKRLIEKMDMVE